MTLSSPDSKVVYPGDGVKTSFDIDFPFLTNADVKVTLTDTNGGETAWVEGTHYTLTGAGSATGGKLWVVTSPVDYTPDANTTLTIRRAPEATQETALPLGGNLSTAVLEQALDRGVMLTQRVLEELDRAPKYPVAEIGAADLPSSAVRANMYLAFNSGGNPIASAGPVGNPPVAVNPFIHPLLGADDADEAQDAIGGKAAGKSVFKAVDADTALDAVGGIKQGKHTIWIPAAAMRPTVTDGCASLADVQTAAGKPDLQVLDFDPGATEEAAQFQVAFPDSWNLGTVSFQVFWTTTATDTKGVAWGLQGVAVTDGDAANVPYGSAAVVTDDAQSAANDVLVTAESSALTIDGTPAEGDLCFFRIFRDTDDANDDMTVDARLIGVKLFYTINARDDA